jgi:hypothetical protein
LSDALFHGMMGGQKKKGQVASLAPRHRRLTRLRRRSSMSEASVAHVYQDSKSKGNARQVLLAIAHKTAADTHRVCVQPSVLQTMTCLSPEEISAAIQELVTIGELAVERIGVSLSGLECPVTYHITLGVKSQYGGSLHVDFMCWRINLLQHQQGILKTVGDLQQMPYTEFLQTDYWRSIRLYLLTTYQSCQLCCLTDQLQVHHRSYRFRGSEIFHLEDLIVLCGNCHARFHDKLPQEPST